jgi:hypothetical protein
VRDTTNGGRGKNYLCSGFEDSQADTLVLLIEAMNMIGIKYLYMT